MEERSLTLKLRGLAQTLVYVAATEEVDRFRGALEDPGTGFFCFADSRGAGIVLNLDQIQYARTGPPGRTAADPPTDVALYFRGQESMARFTMDEQARPEMKLLIDYLRDNYDAEAFIEWEDEDGCTVAVNLSEVALLEYPVDWES